MPRRHVALSGTSNRPALSGRSRDLGTRCACRFDRREACPGRRLCWRGCSNSTAPRRWRTAATTWRLESCGSSSATSGSITRRWASRAAISAMRSMTLAKRLVEIYTTQDQQSSLAVLLGARSLNDLISRFEAANSVSNQDAALIHEVVSFQQQVVHRRTLLRTERVRQHRLVAARAAERNQIEGRVASEHRLYNSVQSQIAQMISAQRASQAAAARAARVAQTQVAAPKISFGVQPGSSSIPGDRYASVVGHRDAVPRRPVQVGRREPEPASTARVSSRTSTPRSESRCRTTRSRSGTTRTLSPCRGTSSSPATSSSSTASATSGSTSAAGIHPRAAHGLRRPHRQPERSRVLVRVRRREADPRLVAWLAGVELLDLVREVLVDHPAA